MEVQGGTPLTAAITIDDSICIQDSTREFEDDNHDEPTTNTFPATSKRHVRLPNQRRKLRKIKDASQLSEETRQAQTEEQQRKQGVFQHVEHHQLLVANDKQTQMQTNKLRPFSTRARQDIIVIGDDGTSSNSDSELSVIGEVPGRCDASKPTVIDCTEMFGENTESHESTQFHVNDKLNVPDEHGRVLANSFHAPGEPDVFVADHIVRALKPHQIGGIRFLYSNIIKDVINFNTDGGFGCILAHCMGLGKTLQVIAFIDIFLRCTPCSRVLCVVPINTLQNWQDEFDKWIPRNAGLWTIPNDTSGLLVQCPSQSQNFSTVVPRRHFKVLILDEKQRDLVSRAEMIRKWFINGGVLLVGYEMYRMLALRVPTLSGVKRLEGKKINKPKVGKHRNEPVIDLDVEEEHMKKLQAIQSMLCDPGPDLVICDEGHRIKNVVAGTSQALKKIRTKRRVVLSGYPLQNNLSEYWCMIDFVRPSYLGTHQDFVNMFVSPIYNGQCVDSTQEDVRVMRQRAHVLHKLVEGFIQRRGHKLLQMVLPEKEEHILFVRLSPLQSSLYNRYIESQGKILGVNAIKAFAICCKIWNHVDILHGTLHQSQLLGSEQDLEIEGLSTASVANQRIKSISYEWANDIMKDHQAGKEDQSGKFLILMEIIDASVQARDRLLVYSQSLATLTLVEEYLARRTVPCSQPETQWKKNKNYFRLDGGTLSQERERLIETFNSPRNHNVWLFLISTRAGSLGVNLIGANRVVILDVSWNPCHDTQAICRMYRYGQSKLCFVYRMVMDGTMERRIYERQITKRGVADRVIDELQPGRTMTRDEALHLMTVQPEYKHEVNWQEYAETCSDPVLRTVCLRLGRWLTKPPLKRDSLALEETEERLTKAEKTKAIQDYVNEKQTGQRSVPSLPSLRDVTSGSMGVAKFPICPSSQHLYKSGQANKSGYFHAFRPMMSNEPVDPHQLALKTIQRMQQQKHQMPIASITAPSGTVAAQRSLINSRHTGMSSTAASPPSPQTQI